MEVFSAEVFENMSAALEKIAADATNTLQMAERSYHAAKDGLDKVSRYMSRYTFTDNEQEVMFFKLIKPKFLRELIYFAELYHIEARKPFIGKKVTELYLKGCMATLRSYFEANQLFYNYYRSAKTHLDHQYFLRHSDDTLIPPEYTVDPDPGLTTFYCFKLSRLQAFEKLKDCLEHALHTLYTTPTADAPAKHPEPHALQWTDTKTGLTELAYALWSKGAFNNGNTDLKRIVTLLERSFNISLGNYYGVFQQNIRIRKKNRTQYLDQLKERLEMRMDEDDENPRL